MLGHGAKFDHKKEPAIAALLSHRNVEEAARAVGISSNTLLRWLKEPEFEAAYREARRTASRESITRLQDASGAAVTTILKIMVDSKVSAGTRLRAAEIVLNQMAKAIEIEDIDERVAELERAASSANRLRKRSAILPWSSTEALPEPAITPALISAAPRLPATSPGEKDNDTDHLRPTSASANHTPSALEPSRDESAVLTHRTTVDGKVR
jgi:transposase-like protein